MTNKEKEMLEEQQKQAATTVVAAPEVQPEEVEEVEEQVAAPTHDYYADIMKAYDERKKADERADRRDRIREAIGGIGDVASALSNLYYTTQYAPSVPQTEGMSDKMRERYEAAKASRDRNRGEWMNYMLNVAGRQQAAEQAAQAQKNFERTQKRLEEQEQRRKDEFEFKQQKEQWRQDFEKEKLDQKAQLSKMNADLKRWSERLKMNRSEVAHSLAGYTIDEYEYRDEQGRRHKVKVRTVYNPKTEQLESEQTDEVQQTSQQTTQQSSGKSLGIGVQSTKPAGKSLGINVKK